MAMIISALRMIKNKGESSFVIVLKTVAPRLFTDKSCRADLC